MKLVGGIRLKRKFIDKYVGITPRSYEELEDRHRKVLDIFSKYKFERILDVGCGDGNFSKLIGEACGAKEVYGIEISEKGVEMARRNGIKCYQLDVDIEDFPFKENFFDAVFAGEIIEHLFDPDHFLNEVYRVLKPQGIFILTTPNLASIHNRVALLLGYQPFSIVVSLEAQVGHWLCAAKGAAPDHIRHFTLRTLKELLKIHGFKILKVKGSCAQLPKNMKFKRLIGALDKFFAKFPGISYRVLIVSRKQSTENLKTSKNV